MRLVGVSNEGDTWVAVERDHEIHLVATVDDFYSDPATWLERARGTDGSLTTEADLEFRVPVQRDVKVLCAGLNYRAHYAESNMAPPSHPDIFGRWANTLVPSGTLVPILLGEPGQDWAGELAAILGRELRNATPGEVEAL